ncbi:MAG: FtsX-like permease family protein [Bdellovibrionaceae bacterium]|nr:FtsX-like permease family protein [Pseudobdellovibrionaceae bacterium]MDW8189495.1 FtsX-like permease family protein [Pseudobdellovibrionaceae bacterium]
MTNFYYLLNICWKNLFRNGRRTIASLLTVAFGSAGLLIFQGFNHGIMNQYRDNTVRGIYSHGQVMKQNYYWKVHENPFQFWIENPGDIEKMLLSLPGVKDVYPRVSFYSFVIFGNRNLAAKGEGILPEREKKFFTELNFIAGTDIEDEHHIALGKGLAESLGVTVGDTVTLITNTVHNQINGIDLKVSGIFHTGIKAFDDQSFRINLRQAQHLLNTKMVEKFGLQLASYAPHLWQQIKEKISALSQDLEFIPFEELDAAYYKNSVAFLDQQFQFIRIIILLIVGLGIFNILSMAFLERSSEFAVLLANGESYVRLFSMLAIEALLMGLIGSLLGIGLALVLDVVWLKNGIPMPPGPGVTRSFLIYLEFAPQHYNSSFIFPTLVSFLSSLLPAYKILSKPVSQMLK